MRESVRKQNQRQKDSSIYPGGPAKATPEPSRVNSAILQVQRALGNQATVELLQAQGNNIDPYKQRRYSGAFYKLSDKFGSDFYNLVCGRIRHPFCTSDYR